MNQRDNGIVYLSTYPPRECGIATFTHDLATAFNKLYNPATKVKVAALDENHTTHYNYPSAILSSIAANDLSNYVTLAERINKDRSVKLVHVQHEFGIFGGEWGNYLIPFLQTVKKPIAITFHSVLPHPDDHLKKTVELIGKHTRAIIVMNNLSKTILETDYALPKSKLFLVPHGIPHVMFEPSQEAKTALGLNHKLVLTTFGMISKDKGIEDIIQALPAIIKEYPNILYLVIGATHPHVLNYDGESYRNFLTNEIERLGLKNHVRFYNKYIALEEIIQYLKATDIYISAARNPHQSVSGTLSYALGCGRAVISTPTEYAKHIIKNGDNGLLVHFRNPSSIACALKELLSDEKRLTAMHQNAFASTRHMTWSNVANAHMKIYKKIATIPTTEKKLPEIKFDHLFRLTDSFGIIQHARHATPHIRWGYSADDNARALTVAERYFEKTGNADLLGLITTYIRFLQYVSRKNGTFANIVNAAKKRDSTNDDDVFGRCMMALGHAAIALYLPETIRQKSQKLFLNGLKNIHRIRSPRSLAFMITSLYFYTHKNPRARFTTLIKRLADKQVQFFNRNSSQDWEWFEDRLTYSNSRLPESLYYAYAATKNPAYLAVAERTLAFLSAITFEKQHYTPIGESGWYARDKERAYFDQQPEDAAAMVETKLLAYKLTGRKRYIKDAFKAFQWFLGKNHLGLMVYNETTGGCHDGVGQNSLNLNQGAESTIAYLSARMAFEDTAIKKYFHST